MFQALRIKENKIIFCETNKRKEFSNEKLQCIFGNGNRSFLTQESFAGRRHLEKRANRQRNRALHDKKAGHPRVNEVSDRQANQDNQIDQGLKDGELSKKEARGDLRDERRIERQKKRMMHRDGGHLTEGDQKKLNSELNAEEAKIKAQESN